MDLTIQLLFTLHWHFLVMDSMNVRSIKRLNKSHGNGQLGRISRPLPETLSTTANLNFGAKFVSLNVIISLN